MARSRQCINTAQIQIPSLRWPTFAELQTSFRADPPICRNVGRILRDDSTCGVMTLRLVPLYRDARNCISFSSYEEQILPYTIKLLGFSQAQWLVDNQDNPETIPSEKARTALKEFEGSADFPATLVLDSMGCPYVPCVYRGRSTGRLEVHWVHPEIDTVQKDAGLIATGG